MKTEWHISIYSGAVSVGGHGYCPIQRIAISEIEPSYHDGIWCYQDKATHLRGRITGHVIIEEKKLEIT